MCSIDFTEYNKKFCFSLQYNGANSYLFVNGKEIIKFIGKDPEIIATPLYLENISKDLTVDNMKITGLNGCVYNFSINYNTVPTVVMPHIHKYLMAKNNIQYKMSGFIKKCFFTVLAFNIDFNKRKFVELYFSEQSRI